MNSLAIFAKAPVLGSVKTRLQPLLGEQGALDAHLELVDFTLASIDSASYGVSLWVSEPHAIAQAWSAASGAELRYQEGPDLGARMHHAISQLLVARSSKACVIGSDCATMHTGYVEQAFELLDSHDVVFGPAADGGYVLVGMSEPCSSLFQGVDWGTSHVLAQSLVLCEAANLSVGLLAEGWDVDTPQEWLDFKASRTDR